MLATVTLNPAVDRTVSVDGSLTDGTITRIENARFDAGGKGINVSKYLAAMDTETVATGVAGGFLGEFITKHLESADIETQFVSIGGCTRMNSTIHTDTDEYKLNQRGPNVSPSSIDQLIEILDAIEPDTVIIGGSLPPGLDTGAIDKLAQAGIWNTAVDVEGDLLDQLEANYEWCKPNTSELEAATEQKIESIADAKAATESLRSQGFETVVASLGSDGALVNSPSVVEHQPAIETDVIDTVGAGDALFSGFLAAKHRDLDDTVALELGVLAATAVIGTVGTAVPSLPQLTATGIED